MLLGDLAEQGQDSRRAASFFCVGISRRPTGTLRKELGVERLGLGLLRQGSPFVISYVRVSPPALSSGECNAADSARRERARLYLQFTEPLVAEPEVCQTRVGRA